MKKSVRFTASVLALLLVGSLGLTSCGKKSGDGEKKYTYRTTDTAPNTWSPTDWQVNSEDNVLVLITTYLWDFAMNATKDGYEIVPEMAAELPEDVTKEYAGNAKYGVPADATDGWAWKVKLNKKAKWDNGTPINADTYVYSFQQFLNPDMKNYRSNSFYSDGFVLANAKGYYAGSIQYDNVCLDPKGPTYADVSDDEMWFSLTQAVPFFGDSVSSYASNASYADRFVVDGVNLFEKLQEIVGEGTYARLTPEAKDYLNKISASFGDGRDVAYKEYCFTRTEKEATPWSDVGVIKNDDYTITFVMAKSYTPFSFVYAATSVNLIREDLYEANKKPAGDIVKSSYGTSLETSASYGPYKITDFQPDKSMHFEKNENWYGWTDGKHKGQYMTTGVDVQYISDHRTIFNLFLQGKVDDTALTVEDMDQYGNSEYRLDEPQSYTWKYTMNSSYNALHARDLPGENHSILANKDFRHGIFLSLDRQKYVDTVAPSHDPGYTLINYLYVAVPETGELYRDSDVAKAAMTKFYGVSDYSQITGYDLVAAKQYFDKAYNDSIASGKLKATDKVVLNLHTYAATDSYMRRVTFLQDAINAATVGTGFEGKITIKQITDQNYYDNLTTGSVDLAVTAWGGSAFDVYGVLWCYCDPSANLEYGFDPTTETLAIELDGKSLTKTYYEWYQALTSGDYSSASTEVRNFILASVEGALLEHYTMAPISYQNVASLNSQRVIEGSDHFVNSLVGFGGIRFRTYSMDDEEWDKYCEESNNQLTY